VVCEPDERSVPALQVILQAARGPRHPAFPVPQQDRQGETPVREIAQAMLQPASTKPLVLRQIPIWENGIATGFIDLALERAFVYREHAPSEIVDDPRGERRARRRRASRCWSSSPTTTTS
jgi:elongation factor G